MGNVSSSLINVLNKNKNDILKYLELGYAKWNNLLTRIKQQDRNPIDDYHDEQIWTFLVACGYSISGENGISKITKILTGNDYPITDSAKIWLETLPYPPREKEGNTHIDLALGSIAKRNGTKSGIELGDTEHAWICFCEMKWYSDISKNVTYDQHRNQLVRVIENAICFRNKNKYAEKIVVTIVTPKFFYKPDIKSRLYHYKYDEYHKNLKHIEVELNICHLKPRQTWDINERLTKLSLKWVCYEELFEKIPKSAISNELKQFIYKYNQSNKSV